MLGIGWVILIVCNYVLELILKLNLFTNIKFKMFILLKKKKLRTTNIFKFNQRFVFI